MAFRLVLLAAAIALPLALLAWATGAVSFAQALLIYVGGGWGVIALAGAAIALRARAGGWSRASTPPKPDQARVVASGSDLRVPAHSADRG